MTVFGRANSPAFTLIEILLAVAVLGLIIGISAPFFTNMLGRTNIDNAVLLSAQSIRRAMLKAQSNEQDSDWGVQFSTAQILLFKGSSFANRDAAFDTITSLDSTVTFSGNTEIVFSKNTAELTASKTLTIRMTNTGETKNITVNTKGALTY